MLPERLEGAVIDIALMLATVDQLVVVSVGKAVELAVDIGLVGIATETTERTRAEVVVVTLTEARSRSVNHRSLLMVLHHGGRSRNIFLEVRQELSVDKAGLRGEGTTSSRNRGLTGGGTRRLDTSLLLTLALRLSSKLAGDIDVKWDITTNLSHLARVEGDLVKGVRATQSAAIWADKPRVNKHASRHCLRLYFFHPFRHKAGQLDADQKQAPPLLFPQSQLSIK
jgi:hypothetical protein